MAAEVVHKEGEAWDAAHGEAKQENAEYYEDQAAWRRTTMSTSAMAGRIG